MINNIVEIIGGDGLEFAFKDLNMNAQCTYKNEQLPFHIEVWEVSADDFKTLCDIPDEKWKDVWGWWRQGYCIYHGNIYNDYIVNGKMDMNQQNVKITNNNHMIVFIIIFAMFII